jgi:hypothetical protein
MKVTPGGITSKNKIVDADAREDLESSEKFKETKTRLDWFEEWIMTKGKWG